MEFKRLSTWTEERPFDEVYTLASLVKDDFPVVDETAGTIAAVTQLLREWSPEETWEIAEGIFSSE